jgi:chemotaxis protein CheD
MSGSDAPAELVYLLPGTSHCARRPAVVTTVLGSCVAVCLWDSVTHAGGMNHYLLPHAPPGDISERFGDVANERLIGRMIQLGARRENLRAKVFGGASVLAVEAEGRSVGEANVEVALEQLRRHRIPIVVRRTGGRRGRLIRLFTDTGEVELQEFRAPAAAIAEASEADRQIGTVHVS